MVLENQLGSTGIQPSACPCPHQLTKGRLSMFSSSTTSNLPTFSSANRVRNVKFCPLPKYRLYRPLFFQFSAYSCPKSATVVYNVMIILHYERPSLRWEVNLRVSLVMSHQHTIDSSHSTVKVSTRTVHFHLYTHYLHTIKMENNTDPIVIGVKLQDF